MGEVVNGKTVAIIQPHYLPWLGYFDMMDQVDIFVLLDTVQFARRSWQHRNRIKTPQGWCWLTLPVSTREGSRPLLRDARIDSAPPWAPGHRKSLEFSYGRAPYWDAIGPWIADLLREVEGQSWLAQVTSRVVEAMARGLGIRTPIVRASQLPVRRVNKAEYLADLCVHLGAKRHLSPHGSLDYLRESRIFEDRGLELHFHRYDHPVYIQRFGDFVSHLSALDLMFNEGPGSLGVLQKGRRPSEPHGVLQSVAPTDRSDSVAMGW